MTYRNRPALIAATCLTALALAGCTENPAAGRPSPTQSSTGTSPSATSPTPSSSPTSSKAPERPAAAKGLTLAAGEAFVYYYSGLMNHAATTGNPAAMLAASDSGCEVCSEYASFIKQSNAANGGLKGDYQERIKEVSNLLRGTSGRLVGSALLTVGTYTSKETPKDTQPLVVKATNYRRELALSPQGGNWVMYEMKLVKQ